MRSPALRVLLGSPPGWGLPTDYDAATDASLTGMWLDEGDVCSVDDVDLHGGVRYEGPPEEARHEFLTALLGGEWWVSCKTGDALLRVEVPVRP